MENISFDYYKVFYYVAKYGSFSKAADVLKANQPNLTRIIKILEKKLSCSLFVRSNRGVKLTQAGESLYEHVAIAFDHISAGEEELTYGRSLISGVVHIGISDIALRCVMLPVLKTYHEHFPGIKIRIHNTTTPQAIKLLNDGRIELAVVTTPLDLDVGFSKIDIKPINEVAVCGLEYESKLGYGERTIEELSEFPIIALSEKTSNYMYYMRVFSELSLKFSPDIEAATSDQIIPLAANNLGIGFVPEEFCENEYTNELIKIRIKDKLPQRYVSLVKKDRLLLSQPAAQLEETIIKAKTNK